MRVNAEVSLPPLRFQRVVAAATLATVVASWIAHPFLDALGAFYLALAPALLALGFAWRRFRAGSVVAGPEGLTLTTAGGVTRIDADRIHTVDLRCDADLPLGDSPPRVYEATVAFADATGALLAQVRTRSLVDAKALVEAISSRTRRTFSGDERRLVLPRREQTLVAVGLALSLFTAVAFVGGTVVTLALFFLPILRSAYGSTRRLVVGEDGFVVHDRLRTKFVPYSDVESIDAGPTWPRAQLSNGEVIELPLRNDAASTVQRSEAIGALTTALSQYRAAKTSPSAIEPNVSDGESPYRRAEPTFDALLGTVENPTLPLTTRVEAARELTRVDPSVGNAVRAAAGRSASDEVRLALDEAAAAELEEEHSLRERR